MLKLVHLPIALLLLVISGSAFSSVIEEIAALEAWKEKGEQSQGPVASVEAPRKTMQYTLQNGTVVDLSRWQFVVFSRSDCKYCHQFAPVLREVSQTLQIPVFVYSFDGRDDSGLGPVAPALPEVVQTFFPELPIATPTTFLLNVDNMVTVPVYQGSTDAENLRARMGMSLQAAYDSGVM
jgi:type-F conjugative transfer system pilin assembly thiol-disulfide isomerase TrbB